MLSWFLPPSPLEVLPSGTCNTQSLRWCNLLVLGFQIYQVLGSWVGIISLAKLQRIISRYMYICMVDRHNISQGPPSLQKVAFCFFCWLLFILSQLLALLTEGGQFYASGWDRVRLRQCETFNTSCLMRPSRYDDARRAQTHRGRHICTYAGDSGNNSSVIFTDIFPSPTKPHHRLATARLISLHPPLTVQLMEYNSQRWIHSFFIPFWSRNV